MIAGFKARNHPQQRASDEVDDRATDPVVFARWHDRFRFTVDAAAAEHNARLPRYWTRRDDGLAQPWTGERVWCNPPYSDIRPWIEKAWLLEAELVVMLLPANRTEQRWWQELIEPYRDAHGSELRVEFIAGRLRFIQPGRDGIAPNERPPFGVCLCVWSPPARPAPPQPRLTP